MAFEKIHFSIPRNERFHRILNKPQTSFKLKKVGTGLWSIVYGSTDRDQPVLLRAVPNRTRIGKGVSRKMNMPDQNMPEPDSGPTKSDSNLVSLYRDDFNPINTVSQT